jgi:Inosine-uridine nucleoside N-ribohydrolase
MRFIVRVFVCFLFYLPVKGQYPVWIDTDGAADDLRAICMLLALPETNILGITSSEGALSPPETGKKVKSLLSYFGRKSIPVGTGRILPGEPPPWRQQSEQIRWGKEKETTDTSLCAVRLISDALHKTPQKITFVCLGTLTNLYDVLEKEPVLKERIAKVIWYNEGTDFGINYKTDSTAASVILKSGIQTEIISGAERHIPITKAYLDLINPLPGPYARLIAETHEREPLFSVVLSGHMKTWDDLIPVYITAPALFTPIEHTPHVTLYTLKNEKAIDRARETILNILSENLKESP